MIMLITGQKKGGGGKSSTPVEAADTLRSKAYARLILLLGSGEWHGLANGLQSVYFDQVQLQNIDGSYNFSNVSTEWRPGTIYQTHLPYGSTAESNVNVGVELRCNQPVVKVINNPNIDIATVTISVPQLTETSTSNGNVNGTSVSYKIEYASSDGVWQNVSDGYDYSGTPQNNITKASKVTGQVQVFAYSRSTGEYYYDELTGATKELYLTIPVDFRVEAQKDGGSWYSVITGKSTLYADSQNPNYSGNDSRTKFNFELGTDPASTYNLRINILTAAQSSDKTRDSAFVYVYTQSTNYSLAISGKTTSAYEKATSFRLQGEAPWQVRVTRLTADSTTSYLVNKTYWSTYSEIVEEKLSYPLSVLLGVSIDASQFSSIPTVAADCYMQIMQVPSNYDAWTRAYSGDWNGTFKMSWTDNPAWCFYNMLTDPVDGLGDIIESERIEGLKWDLYAIAKYCDELIPDGYGGMEPRFTCNMYIQERETAINVLSDIASIFRGMVYESAGGIYVSQDSPKEPVYLFNNANVIDGVFTYASSHISNRHNLAKITYTDRENFDEQGIECVEDFESISNTGRINETSVIAVGCASRGQARRCGKWLLFTERYESDTVTFNTGLEGMALHPGDVIEVADQFRAQARMGGRVFCVDGYTVKLDKSFSFSPGLSYSIKIIDSSGIVAKSDIVKLEGEFNEIKTVTALGESAKDSVYIISSDELVSQKFRIVSIAENENGIYQVSGLKYVSSKYAYVEQNETLVLDNTQKSNVISPVGDIKVTEVLFESNGAVRNKVALSWAQVTLAKSYETSYRLASDNWISAGEVTVPTIDLLDLIPGTYTFKVTAKSIMGLKSSASEVTRDISGLLTPPEPLTRLDISALGDFAILSWDQATDLNVRIGGYIKIRFSTKINGARWGDGTDIGGVISGDATQVQLPLLAGTYLAKPVNSSGIEALEAIAVSTEYVAISEMATINEIAFNPEFEGEHNGTYVSGSLLSMHGAVNFDSWPSVDAIQNFDTGAGSLNAGEWVAGKILDIDDIYNCRILASVTATSLGNTPFIDEWGYIDDMLDIDGGTSSANVKIYISVTLDDPSENNWGDWQEFYIGDYRGRAFRFKLVLISDEVDKTIVVEKFSVSMYMPGRLESANDVLITAAGARISFDRKFKYPPTVHISVQSLKAGEYYIKSGLSEDGFNVQIVDSTGAGMPRTIDWIAKGYGYGSE